MNWICTPTGLLWTLLELHRAVMKRGKITGPGMSIMLFHRAVLKFLELSPGWNEYHDISPGRSELSGTFTGLE
jgi:hypothetical protein